MRMLLPIKGPGGRALTPREKLALLILGVTLVVCVLTLLAGDRAFRPGEAQNPVLAMVSLPSRFLGGGVMALYALILVWTALIYFKGEKVARGTPLGGRILAAIAVTVGISGVLGVAEAATAGSIGNLVGSAIGNVLGGAAGVPLLLLLALVGLSLAAQGSLAAIQEPTPRPAPQPKGLQGFGSAAIGYATKLPPARRAAETPLPDDGDPTAESRTLAVTQAMEEIERRKGVTILEVQPEAPGTRPAPDDELLLRKPEETAPPAPEAATAAAETPEAVRPSIGEEVAEAPPPAPGSEEAQIQRGLLEIVQSIDPAAAVPAEEEPRAGFSLPPPPAPESPPAGQADGVLEEGYGPPYVVEEGPVAEACSEPMEPPPIEQAGIGGAPGVAGAPPGEALAAPPEAGAVPPAEEKLPPPAPPGIHAEESPAPESSPSDAPSGDPYARPGLLRGVEPAEGSSPDGTPDSSTSFDWRGRPLN